MGRLKVEWNEAHSWKVTKKYDKDGKVIAMKWMGEWYYPRKDYSGRDWMYGGWYIASDVCDHCALEKYCKANNPINHACEEADQSEINWY